MVRRAYQPASTGSSRCPVAQNRRAAVNQWISTAAVNLGGWEGILREIPTFRPRRFESPPEKLDPAEDGEALIPL
jgi:hypothetical protein